MNAEVTLDGRKLIGTVAGISPDVRNSQVTGRVRFAEQPKGLRQNQRASVRIVLDERNDVLKVARSPFNDSDTRFVYVVRDDDAVRMPGGIRRRGHRRNRNPQRTQGRRRRGALRHARLQGRTQRAHRQLTSLARGSPMLSMTNVSKVFRTDLIETHALRNFSLDVKAGEFLAVTGPSGSGKTTFLNIAGLLEPYDTGTYKLDDVDVTQLSDDARSHLRNQKIGFIFQSFNLMPDLNVYDNVDVPLALPAHEGRRTRQAHHQCARDRGPGGAHETRSGAALRRPAAARGHRARHRRRPEAGAGRRAHRQPRFADGAPGHGPAREDQRDGHHHHHGHARSRARAPRAPQRAGGRRPDLRFQALRTARRATPATRSAVRWTPPRREPEMFAYYLRLALRQLPAQSGPHRAHGVRHRARHLGVHDHADQLPRRRAQPGRRAQQHPVRAVDRQLGSGARLGRR